MLSIQDLLCAGIASQAHTIGHKGLNFLLEITRNNIVLHDMRFYQAAYAGTKVLYKSIHSNTQYTISFQYTPHLSGWTLCISVPYLYFVWLIVSPLLCLLMVSVCHISDQPTIAPYLYIFVLCATLPSHT